MTRGQILRTHCAAKYLPISSNSHKFKSLFYFASYFTFPTSPAAIADKIMQDRVDIGFPCFLPPPPWKTSRPRGVDAVPKRVMPTLRSKRRSKKSRTSRRVELSVLNLHPAQFRQPHEIYLPVIPRSSVYGYHFRSWSNFYFRTSNSSVGNITLVASA